MGSKQRVAAHIYPLCRRAHVKQNAQRPSLRAWAWLNRVPAAQRTEATRTHGHAHRPAADEGRGALPSDVWRDKSRQFAKLTELAFWNVSSFSGKVVRVGSTATERVAWYQPIHGDLYHKEAGWLQSRFHLPRFIIYSLRLVVTNLRPLD